MTTTKPSNRTVISIINVYAPVCEEQCEAFYAKLADVEIDLQGKTLVGGEFNSTNLAQFDRTSTNGSRHISLGLERMIANWGLIDTASADMELVKQDVMSMPRFQHRNHTYRYRKTTREASSRLDRWYGTSATLRPSNEAHGRQ